ncbi:MAG: archease, partial [Proteobacteria bacterium]|nr:archease [Pseudomonadota bacterium]
EDLSCKESFEIEIEGSDREDLLINWLRGLLYLHQVKGMLLKSFSISKIDDSQLSGTVEGERFDTGRHIIKREVKAATYHDLSILQEEGQWTARVIFDL